jgi:ribosomal-protein-alanine N-acetyltransferase
VIEIEPMVAADLDDVDAIERHSFKLPWPRRVFAEELTRSWARIDVARAAGRVIGFIDYWLVTDEIHVLAVATHPDHRRRGVAGRLVERVVSVARAQRASLISLEVRRGNVPAIALYERFGFHRVGVRPRYYQEDGEDAVVMTLDLSMSPPVGTVSPGRVAT